MHGRSGIAEQLASIFADHEVATYVRVVRAKRMLDDQTGLLHAVVGTVPPEATTSCRIVMPCRC